MYVNEGPVGPFLLSGYPQDFHIIVRILKRTHHNMTCFYKARKLTNHYKCAIMVSVADAQWLPLVGHHVMDVAAQPRYLRQQERLGACDHNSLYTAPHPSN